MPRSVQSIKAEIRDHSMSVPVPENTLRHGIPNACNLCHKDRDAAWSVAQMNLWYADTSPKSAPPKTASSTGDTPESAPGQHPSRLKWIRRADAFAAAAKGDPAAVPLLIEILDQPAEGPLARANALSHLARFPSDPRTFPAMQRALRDEQPLVRAVAALRFNPNATDKPSAIRSLTPALADPVATVRMGAAVSLVILGVKDLPGADGVRLEQARELYRARADFNSDDAEQQMGAGRFYLLTGDPVRALSALEASLRIDPQVPARYLLAAALVQQNQVNRAKEVLLTIPPADPDFPKAERLLKAIEAASRQH